MKEHSNSPIERHRKWKEHVRASKQHAGTVSSYCREQGISRFALEYWRRKFDDEHVGAVTRKKKVEAREKVAKSAFIPVEVLPAEVDPGSCRGLPDPKWVAQVLMHLAAGSGR